MRMSRIRSRFTICLALFSGWAPRAAAQPPSIASISPRGAQRGQTVVLVIEGANLHLSPELLVGLPSPRALVMTEALKPAPNRIAFELRVNETDAPGPYPLRVRTDDGISNPVLFLVGVFPEVAEPEEPNDLPEAAKPIQIPVTVNGALGAADRDTFRFSAKAGQRISFEVEARRIGSALDPTLHLLAQNGREMALSEDARGLGVDCRLDYTFPADGEFLVQVHDSMYVAHPQNFYRLKAGPIVYADGVFPMGGRRGSDLLVTFEGGSLPCRVAERVRLALPPPAAFLPVALPPGEDTAGSFPFAIRIGDLPEVIEAPRAKPEDAQPFAGPATVNGRIEKAGEVDRYALAVRPGQRWVFEVEAQALGSLLDGVLALEKPDGARLAAADDNGMSPDPRLEFTVPEGVAGLTVSIEDLHRRGGTGFAYRITAREARAEFLLSLGTTAVNLPLQGTEIIEVDVTRRGYDGPVRLEVLAPPPGFTVRGGQVPPGGKKGYLSVSAPAAAKLRALDLVVRGHGEGDVEPALALGAVFLATDRNVPVSPLTITAAAAAVARPLPVVIRAEEGPVRIPLGQARQVKVQALRAEGGEGAMKLQGIFAPAGITVAEGSIAEKASEGTIAFNAAPNAPLGEGEASVRAVGRVGGRDVAAAAPIFPVVVVPPFAIELTRAAVEGPLGGPLVLEAKIAREPPFAGTIDLKVEGLPAGVSAQPPSVPGNEASFKIAFSVAEPAKPGKLDLKLSASTKLGDAKNPTVFTAPALPFSLSVTRPVKAVDAGKPAASPPAGA